MEKFLFEKISEDFNKIARENKKHILTYGNLSYTHRIEWYKNINDLSDPIIELSYIYSDAGSAIYLCYKGTEKEFNFTEEDYMKAKAEFINLIKVEGKK